MEDADLTEHVVRVDERDEETTDKLLTLMLTRCWPTLQAQKS